MESTSVDSDLLRAALPLAAYSDQDVEGVKGLSALPEGVPSLWVKVGHGETQS